MQPQKSPVSRMQTAPGPKRFTHCAFDVQGMVQLCPVMLFRHTVAPSVVVWQKPQPVPPHLGPGPNLQMS